MVPWRTFLLTLLRANLLTQGSGPPTGQEPLCSAPGRWREVRCAECGLPVSGGCHPPSACHRWWAVGVCFRETTDAVNEPHQRKTHRNRAAVVARVLGKVGTHVVPSGCLALGLGVSGRSGFP